MQRKRWPAVSHADCPDNATQAWSSSNRYHPKINTPF
jgi:hypothetical protein